MKVSLTLSDKVLDGDIPQYIFEQPVTNADEINDAQALFYQWLESKDLKESVFVCFENFGQLVVEDLRDEQKSFLVSHDFDAIADFCTEGLMVKDGLDIDFAVFEFADYREAFGYCTDLKESF